MFCFIKTILQYSSGTVLIFWAKRKKKPVQNVSFTNFHILKCGRADAHVLHKKRCHHGFCFGGRGRGEGGEAIQNPIHRRIAPVCTLHKLQTRGVYIEQYDLKMHECKPKSRRVVSLFFAVLIYATVRTTSLFQMRYIGPTDNHIFPSCQVFHIN